LEAIGRVVGSSVAGVEQGAGGESYIRIIDEWEMERL
jgi:hypothetical protein